MLLRRLKFYISGEKYYKKLNYDWHKYSHRFDIINNIIKKNKYNSYLEIGCQADVSFKKILAPYKIGVDPMDGGTHRMTSDDFFKDNKKNFDIIFIDGLHEYSQVLRDIKNSIRFLNKKGVILIHDCLPAKIWHQTIPQTHSSWNGDVWKAIVKCRTLKDIETYTCVADQGLGVVLKKKNKYPLEDNIRDFKNLTFKDYYNNHKRFMNLIDENELYDLIK